MKPPRTRFTEDCTTSFPIQAIVAGLNRLPSESVHRSAQSLSLARDFAEEYSEGSCVAEDPSVGPSVGPAVSEDPSGGPSVGSSEGSSEEGSARWREYADSSLLFSS